MRDKKKCTRGRGRQTNKSQKNTTVKGKATEERDREMKANLVMEKKKKRLTSGLNFERRLCLYPLCGC
jgi:hypothetical protein